MRNAVAERYAQTLPATVSQIPSVISGGISTWAQYTIEHANRDGLAAHLRAAGVPTAVYYPVPMHIQSAYSHYPRGAGGLPVTEAKASQVISLPMHPYMTPQTQDRIVAAIAGFNG